MGSHPPTLIAVVRRTLREECNPGHHVVAAVSGGRDSLAMLHVLARLRDEFGFELTAHGVDHGLRSEAQAELALARAVADAESVPFRVSAVTVPAGGNLQARARAARRESLLSAASSDCLIATGHHADDRAETVLIRLLQGSGPRGLAALPPRAGRFMRPLIRAPRAAVDAHVARHAIEYADDPSNADARFLRSRVRHELMPLLTALSPGIAGHLNALADQLSAGDGGPAELNRAQRQQLDRVLALGRGAVRISDDQELVLRKPSSRS